ncbi:Cocaine esterase [Frankia canadensis]|uniref:Cocaine esterase n=1 Tax=Frankia canadensis TaxID=1836972 RepID=A0A2I2KM98_9ACTN|nr:CocE/NonD family hydrolase [Frankia canadensis]SNQ46791.1 Cocaine esterase [Frankia canadensis]SOU54081.1 Cocaine esterase [Frankia canadensis]
MGFRVERDVMVPMRDGVRLAADVWIPDGDPAPTLLVRIPYGKMTFLTLSPTMPGIFGLLDAGYAVVWQDCRGTFASEGEFTAFVDEPDDGVDTIAWVREQPWCDGNVGMYGPSYMGITQWALASRAPDGLKALAPTTTATDLYAHPWYSEGGAMSWHTVWVWNMRMALLDAQRALAAGRGDPQTLRALVGSMAAPQAHLGALPAEQDLLAKHVPWWSDWLAHPDRDSFWQELSVGDRADTVTVPALNVGGWFDVYIGSTARTYTQMKAEAGSAEARDGQRLIIGPWDHISSTGVYHDRRFGLGADPLAADLTGAHVRFFDRWLRGRTDALDGMAPVRIFVMGIDQWRDEQDWPLPDTSYVDYFLDGAGAANTAAGDGVLHTDPASAEATDTFTYDPANPVPSLGGRMLLPAAANAVGPVDQRPAEARDDVLCFTTPVLDEPIEVTGHVSLVLHVASSARDTDFTGKLVDVHPDGRALYLTDGILRVRYRRSLAEPELLEPETVHEITLDLSVTSNVFLPGHRIRLEVSSSNFPRYDRNTNTGAVINTETFDQAVVATNRVLHGPQHPSRLVLPIIRR